MHSIFTVPRLSLGGAYPAQFGSVRRRFLATGALLLASLATAHAQTFPTQRVRIVTAFSAGSGPDAMLRVIAEELGKVWKVPVIVDNKPGGSGFIAISEAKRAQPDGLTLLHIEGVNVTAVPHMYSKLPYDSKKDLLPITPLHGNHFFIAVPASSPWKNVGELLVAAKQAPEKVTFGSWQIGSIAHLGAEMLSDRTGVKMTHVAYKEFASLYQSLARSDINWSYASIASAGALEKAGKLRFIAIAGPSREPSYPTVPTVAESGGPAGFEASSWVGLFAPAGTPHAVVSKINTDVRDLLQQPTIASRMREVGYTQMGASPEDTEKLITRQYQEIGAIIKKINLRLD